MQHSTLLTEYTDISQRLEYLVAHSSQMVFITGEDVAVQQGFVEAFLGQQSQRANVAYIAAKRGKSAQYYLQQLAQQLGIPLSRNSTLAQAFANRSDKNEPVLIAITGAENTPEDVLRELWDLVLQNRFARNGEQINILMFGEHYWAEDVKSWLPTNNNDKPVLLTTQTLEYDEETEIEGDLNEMIANRRKLFQERMKSRANNPALRQPPLQKWWVKLALALVFVASFSSLLIWQYFDVTSSAVKEFTQFLFQSKPEKPTPVELQLPAQESGEELATLSESNDNQRVAANFSDAMQRLETNSGDENQLQSESAPQDVAVSAFSKQSADSPSSEFIADISTEQLKQLRDTGTIKPQETAQNSEQNTDSDLSLAEPEQVVSAQEQALAASVMDALATLEMMQEQPVTEAPSQTDTSLKRETEIAQQPQALPETLEVTSQPLQSSVVESAPEPVNSSEQNNSSVQNNASEPSDTDTEAALLAQLESLNNEDIAQPLTNGAVNDYPVEDIVVQDVIETAEVNQTSSQSTEPAWQYHEPILLELSDNQFVLQISGISSESLLQEYLVDNRLLNEVWVYKTQRYGGDWFVVLKNQSFTSLNSAREAGVAITEQFSGSEPFAKSVAQVRSEIAAGN